jgi:hypothetical protein
MRSAVFNISSIRECPHCGGHRIATARRKAEDFELFVLPFLLMRPYRCAECGARHYNVRWARKVGLPRADQPNVASIDAGRHWYKRWSRNRPHDAARAA